MTTLAASAALARVRWMFLVAAVYDIALGVGFFFLYRPVFEWLGMTLPPHVAFIQLPALFIFVQGLSYVIVYQNPLANLGLAKVGVVYKGSYSALAAYYLVTDQIPSMFFAWFGLFDLFFFLGFVWFLRWAGREATSS